jgi:hypothetical protein
MIDRLNLSAGAPTAGAVAASRLVDVIDSSRRGPLRAGSACGSVERKISGMSTVSIPHCIATMQNCR